MKYLLLITPLFFLSTALAEQRYSCESNMDSSAVIYQWRLPHWCGEKKAHIEIELSISGAVQADGRKSKWNERQVARKIKRWVNSYICQVEER